MVSGFTKEQNHLFNFVDIESFICSQIAVLNKAQITYLLANLTEFISEYDRPLKTRDIWNEHFPTEIIDNQ